MDGMTDKEICEALKNAILPIIRRQSTKARQAECASFILSLGWELTRGLEGNDFMRGWIDGALEDLNTNPEYIVLQIPH